MIHIQRITAHGFKQLQEVDLVLPRRGRFLVQGLNEAGKSTLFEAIFFGLFGRPLATETSHARLDDVIRYDAEEAWVAIEVALDGGRVLRVMRRVRRGKANRWELDVIAPDGEVEEVRGNRVVNDRVEAELGFDGEALLNTCFVEQKKLEKLEGMGRAQREQSLMKLLNLDRMLELSDELKVRHSDQAALERKAARAELAVLQAEIPGLEARGRQVTLALARAQAREALKVARGEAETLATLTAEVEAAQREAEALQVKAAEAERLRAVVGALREGRTARDRAVEAAAGRGRLEGALAAAVRARDEEEPRVVARGRALGRLRRRQTWLVALAAERETLLSSVGETDARLAELARDRQTLNEVRQALVAARGAERDAETDREVLAGDIRAFDVRDALRGWVAAREAVGSEEEGDAAIEATRAGLEAARRRMRLEAVVLVAGIATFLAGFLWVAWLAVGALVLGAVLAWRLIDGAARVGALREDLGRLEGEAAVRARDAALMAEREADAAARLRAHNAVVPATSERGHAAIAELDDRLGDRSRSDVDEALQAVNQDLANARAQIKTLEAQEGVLRASSGRVDAAALGRERDTAAARAERIGGVLARREPALAAAAARLGVDLDPAQIDHELGVLRGEVKSLRAQAEAIPEMEGRLAEADAALATYWPAAESAWSALPPDEHLPAWSRDLSEPEWDAASERLTAAYAAAGGDAVRKAAGEAAQRAAGLAGRRDSADVSLRRTLAELAPRAKALEVEGLVVPVAPDPAALDAAVATLAALVDAPATELAAERERVERYLNVKRHDAGRLERELGLKGEILDPEETAGEHAEAQRSLAVRHQAVAILDHAGRNVVQRILPSTIEHMRRLLPSLTQGRYFDAQLSDDYQIEVYDDRARAWKRKNIFSGGTRDQLSLALRLAFALATLPEEHGTAPSFVFLDEPLSAFDSERARALIGLITEGEIAESFDQVFLISHVRVDRGVFDYCLTMDGGRVVESDLPSDVGKAGYPLSAIRYPSTAGDDAAEAEGIDGLGEGAV